MLNIDNEFKKLYRSDSTDKNLILDFYRPGEDKPFLSLWDGSHIKGESMKITESLCSGKNLDFGSCDASRFEIVVINVEEEIRGAKMVVYQTLEGLYPDNELYPGTDLFPSGYTMPLGVYTVQTADRQADRKYRNVVALDNMRLFDVNVVDWYNSLPFPLTLRDFRARLCQHIGVAENVPDYLPNDGMLVEKTIEAAELMGRDVLKACEQLNGVFGHFGRDGMLRHVVLQSNINLVPAVDLYPSEDLFPVLPGEMNTQVFDEEIGVHLYKTCRIEEYTVQSIEKVQIRQEEGDIGAIYGTGTNVYTIEGNFLVFGKSAVELAAIAQNVYGMVSKRPYMPFKCDLKGLPYLEVGDTEVIHTDKGEIATYIIKRTLKGIAALSDSQSATGDEIRRTETNINTEIIQLKGKAAILKRTVEEVSAHLIDFEKETEAKFTITAEQITAEVKRASEAEAALRITADQISLSVKNLREDTESQFIQTAGQIALKVSKGTVSSELMIEPDKIHFETDRLSWKSRYSSMTSDGHLTCQSAEIYGDFSTAIFEATDQEIWLGDFYISADGSNVLQSSDSSVSIQTAEGGPFGRYSVINLSSSSGETVLSDHHLETGSIEVRNEIFMNTRYMNGWGVSQTLEWLDDRISDLEDYL